MGDALFELYNFGTVSNYTHFSNHSFADFRFS
jgi:hypothetical protein